MKTCSRCGVHKPIFEFSKRSASPDGLNASCKKCCNAYQSKARAKYPERYVGYRRAYYETHREIKRESALNWKKSNPAKAIAQVAKRRAAKLKATPKWADFAKIELFYEEAQFATEFFGIPFSVDHIVPLQSDLVCGLHWEENLQVLTTEANISKHNRWWPDMP